ncbi:Os12g0620900 [Oryza sativa Japonica Group]|uniref:Os12g0620900 protein n=1 Tax=Oryza sativa subsp. japonica TaxID=39947 RepID=C7J9V7_ORYSJ|nr:Os12g0620900 [Oryza sativa Japonica Group]|eukprot:NP_001177065.1 Os12g0620900 [Oryza sativa Japonica Group]
MRACAALVYCSFVIIVQSTISDQGVIFGEYVSEFSCSNGTFLQPPLCASVWRVFQRHYYLPERIKATALYGVGIF